MQLAPRLALTQEIRVRIVASQLTTVLCSPIGAGGARPSGRRRLPARRRVGAVPPGSHEHVGEDTFYEGDRQSALFRWLLDRRHHDDAVADRSQLPVLAASATLDAALGRRLDHTVANYPALDGTLVVIDTSSSMTATVPRMA